MGRRSLVTGSRVACGAAYTLRAVVFRVTTAPAPITHSLATVIPSRTVELDPKKQRSAMVTHPETTACDATKQ